MKLTKSLNPLLLAAVTAGTTALTFTSVAHAGASASIGAANLYLFRGQNLSNSAPQVYGSLDYEHEFGAYAGIWGSSEGAGGKQEFDLYVGFAGEVGDFSYDVNLTAYEYPSNTEVSSGGRARNSYGDSSEFILNLGFAGASFTVVDSLQGEAAGAGYFYYTLGYDTDMFGATVGYRDNPDDTNYTHLDLNFYATEELTFTLSQIVDQDPSDTATANFNEDLLFVVNWSKSFDL